jgi:hypothetical protein
MKRKMEVNPLEGGILRQMLLLYGSRNGKEYEPTTFPIFDLTPSRHDIRKNPA